MAPRAYALIALVVGLMTVAVAPWAGAAVGSRPTIAFVQDNGTGKRFVVSTASIQAASGVSLTFPSSPVWTADGARVVVQDVGRVEIFSGGDAQFTPAELEREFAPAFASTPSPDAASIVYADAGDCRPSGCTLTLSTVDGSHSALLGTTPGTLSSPAVAWSPDGSRIAYELRGPAGGMELWRANADGTGSQLLTPTPQGVTSLVWLADGRLLFVDGPSIAPRVWVYRPGDPSPILFSNSAFGDTAWVTRSPDGGHFAILGSGSGSPDSLTVFALDGSQTFHDSSRIFFPGGGSDRGLWSPDSGHLLYAKCTFVGPLTPLGPCALVLVDAASGGERTLLDGPATVLLPSSAPFWFAGASFSPDGAEIVASLLDATLGKRQLELIETGTGNITRFSDGNADDTLPAWAPVTLSSGTELAQNGGFEGDITAAWRGVHERGGTALFNTTSDAHTGSQAGKISSTDDSTSLARFISTKIPVTPGQTYRFSAELRAVGLDGVGRLDVTFFDADGAYIPDSSLSSADAGRTVQGSTDWTPLSVKADAPDGAATVRLEVRLYGEGVLLVDDASLIAGQ